jgi:electron transfer flavoprotein alpha subunit
MAVLIVAETQNGKLKKASIEVMSYGARVAAALQTTTTALVYGNADDTEMAKAGQCGVQHVLHVNQNFANFNPAQFLHVVLKAIDKTAADTVIFAHDYTGRSIAPQVAAKMEAGLISGAVSLPDTTGGFSLRKNVFSGKAIADYSILSSKRVISLMPNSVQPELGNGTARIEPFSEGLDAANALSVERKAIEHKGGVPLTEADLVVSAGRGMKAPENWNIIEDLASSIGAATACSRPVADIGWRPHHEHVGQTGIAIRPNLYIAVGISGAIQHLAGVNQSKVIVVINKDAEAPFFKAADYGVVGDAMEVVPKLTAAFRKFKAAQ